MEEDREIQAISKVNAALKELTEDERYRVIQWVANKYVQNATPLKVAGPTEVNPHAGMIEGVVDVVNARGQEEPQDYDTFAELLEATGAEAQADLLIAAGYWLQVVKGAAQWTTREANNLLKPTGLGIDRMDNLIPKVIAEKPKRLIQVAKNKSAAGHGHRQLKLTDIGINWIRSQLSGK